MEALRERFGKYHVLEKIAQGGMAEVYKVKTVGIAGFEKIQALKRILPTSAREGRFIRSFVDEARIAVELTHRNIVQVFDFGKADGELFLAMELIEGRDLRTAMSQGIERELPPPIPVAAFVIAEVSAGLDYAHRKADGYGRALGIVHCDVSPANVMLSTEGYVKILDFGIARATFSSALERRRLRGKPRYMAPEQTRGEPPTAAADVFALGIIAWELFTGLPLFRGPNVKAILEAVRKTTPPRVDQLNPTVPKAIADAIAIALSRDPAARGTAADLTVACAHTAMLANARALAAWLAELDSRMGEAAFPQHNDVISISMQKAGSRDTSNAHHHPVRPVPSMAAADGRMDGAEIRPRETVPPPSKGAPEATVTAPSVFDPTDTGVTRPETPRSVGDQRFIDRDPTGRWGYERTGSGHLNLAEALPDLSFQSVEATVPTAQYEQQARENDTRYDELEVEAEAEAPPASEILHDEPIDDDLGASTVGVLAERRRTVVVAGLLAGAPSDVLRPVTRSLGELAYQRGGVVIAQGDDFLFVAFGLEIAGEDDVAIAMGWALDAGAMARDAASDPGTGVHALSPPGTRGAASPTGGITFRLGARTGVPTTAGPDGAMRIPPEASEEARALARAAVPDRPLFVGSAGRITSALYELGEVPAPRGFSGTGKVLQVIGPRGFDERDRAQFEHRGRFIGRTTQLTELEVWFQRAVAADRRLVTLITGAAGTGKSRLIREFVDRRTATGTPMRVAITAANPALRLSPFALVIDLYRAALELPPARGRGARVQVVQRLIHLMTDAGTAIEHVRAIAADLDRAMELRDGVGVGAPEIADLRPRISAGLAAFREVMADRTRPQLTVIEDLHQADRASIEVLRHALGATAKGPELLVLSTRPEGPPPPAVDAVLSIGDLIGGELRALIADRLGEVATPLNIAAVLGRGGGNPLFIEELAQAVREAGDDVPASAREVVAARVDRLSTSAKSALQFASVIGGTVRVRLIEELLGGGLPAGRGPGDSQDALARANASEFEELISTGFLARDESPEGATNEGELHFARGLIREVVYESLPATAQRESHLRVGRLLASRYFSGREEPPAAIAEHLERGGEPAGAAAFWLRAGRIALNASDIDAAIGCFSRTLVLERALGVVPPTPTSRARRRGALAGREEAHRLEGDLTSHPDDLDELERLCADEPARLADVAIRRAQRMLRLGDYANASSASVAAERHALAANDGRLQGEALRARGEILERIGRFDDALAAVGRARELFHRQGAVTEEMAAMIGRGRIHLMRAHYEAARDAYKPVLALIDQTGDPWLERIVKNHVAVIEMCLGNFGHAMECAQRSLELCRRYGDRPREGDALSVGGIVLLEVGLYEQAASRFGEALDLLGRTASPWSRADCLTYAGVCDARRGRRSGIAMIDEALSEARRLGARYLEAHALVARSGARLRDGALDGAIQDAADGTRVAREATLVGYEIQGLASHARALGRSGNRTAEAGALVHRALALLDHQKYVEGSEEEVLAACVEVLRATGATDRAAAVQIRARASARRKLDALGDPAWRLAYAAIPEITDLLADGAS